ncbi:PQQ-binding-like beta-propeller repeat protein [Alteromonas macleodii]|uniref:outer membrane protein assembly factor BamB family protein n=1 Tax=Alteromonas macleodii TaxID=28108 RepID=UPI003BF7ACB5
MKYFQSKTIRNSIYVLFFMSLINSPVAFSEENAASWSVSLDSEVWSSPLLTVNNNLIIGADDGTLFSLSQSGDELWNVELQGSVSSTPIETSNGSIVVGTENGQVYNISSEGKIQWSFDVETSDNVSVRETRKGIIFAGASNGEVHVFDSDGELLYTVKLGEPLSNLFAKPDSDGVFVTTQNGKLVSLDHSGMRLWEFQTNAQVSAPVFDKSGNVYITTLTGNVISLDQAGRLRWTSALNVPIWASPVITSNDNVIVVGLRGKARAFDTTGTLLWLNDIGAVVDSTPVSTVEGPVYFATRDNRVVAISQSGETRWTTPLATPIFANLVLNEEGNLVAVGIDGLVSMINTETTPLNLATKQTLFPGDITFELPHYSFEEGEQKTIALIRKNGSYGAVDVRVFTKEITASSGTDFTALDLTIRFEDGETEKQFALESASDNTDEADETFELVAEVIGSEKLNQKALVELKNVKQQEAPSPKPESSVTSMPQPAASSKSGGSLFISLFLLSIICIYRRAKGTQLNVKCWLGPHRAVLGKCLAIKQCAFKSKRGS